MEAMCALCGSVHLAISSCYPIINASKYNFLWTRAAKALRIFYILIITIILITTCRIDQNFISHRLPL